MRKRKPIQTSEELVSAFADLFNEEGPTTQEEVDEILRITGHDPDEVGAKMMAVAEEAFANELQRWQDQASRELEEERARITNFESTPVRGPANIISAINRLYARLDGQVALSYRNLESESEESLTCLLHDLEYLVSQQKKRDEGDEG